MRNVVRSRIITFLLEHHAYCCHLPSCVQHDLMFTTPPHANLYPCEQAFLSERESNERNVDTNTRHDFERLRIGGEEEDEKGLGDRRLLDASPPLNRKRPSGPRPFAGRSPPRGGFRLEGAHEHDGEGSMVLPAERERKQGCSDDGDSGCRSDDNGIPGDANRTHLRNTATTQKEDETLQRSDATAAILNRTTSFDGERVYANRGNDRDRQNSDAETVRIVAESFVDDVLDGLSASASMMSLT